MTKTFAIENWTGIVKIIEESQLNIKLVLVFYQIAIKHFSPCSLQLLQLGIKPSRTNQTIER